jgi:hypothetical protein
MGNPLIFEISSEVSVFHVPGSPQVISRVPDFNVVLINSAKGSLNCASLTVSSGNLIIKLFQQEEHLVSRLNSHVQKPRLRIMTTGVCNGERILEAVLRGTYFRVKAKLNSQTAISPKRRKQKWKHQKLKTRP